MRDCAGRDLRRRGGLPPVRLLVNNAARFAWDGFGEFSADEFAAHMAVNVRAPALLIDRFARDQHADRRTALVVNLLDSKLAAPNPDYLSYTLSKQALAGLTELAARALARARHPGQRHRSRADASIERPERGEFRGDACAAIRCAAASSPPTWSRRSAISIGARCVTGQVLVIDSGQRFLGLDRVTCSSWANDERRQSSRVSCPIACKSVRRGSCSKSLEVQADIGFHDFEIGAPQRLLVTVEIWLDDALPPADDDPAARVEL